MHVVSGRKDAHHEKYTDWKQLWHPNYEDYSRAEASLVLDNNTVTNVTVQMGATAYLHCRVRHTPDRALGGGDVSIFRILAISSGNRFWTAKRISLDGGFSSKTRFSG